MDTPNVAALHIIVDQSTGGNIILPPVEVTMNTTIDSMGRTVLSYTGEQSIGTYLQILESLQYINNEDEPIPGSVRLLVQVFTPSEVSGPALASNVAEATIEIVPLNDNPPTFSQTNYSGEVEENLPSGSVVLTVEATDADIYSGVNITYQIAGETSDFYINPTSGEIFTSQPLDAETNSLYQLMVIASDNDGSSPQTSSVLITISVLDVNDHTPVFNRSHYVSSVTENAAGGEPVLAVTATDGDLTLVNSAITYELQYNLLDGGSGSGHLTPLPPQQSEPIPFTINSTTGVIAVVDGAGIDYETVTMYSLQVVATDSGVPRLSSSAGVTIFIENENDRRPQFTQSLYTGVVAEDSPLGTAILTVSATDDDSMNVTYKIEDTEYLEVDSISGQVTLNMAVDFSVMPVLTAVVVACDNGSPPLVGLANLSVEVVNINNNPPIFSEESYAFTVIEGQPLREQVIATDRDEDTITYSAQSGLQEMFTINSTSGVITTLPGIELDYETQQLYILTIEATDATFTSTVTVSVAVQDINDNAPFFVNPQYTATLPESSTPGSSIVQVEAEDRDSGSNAVTVYSIADPGGVFGIGEETGIITLEQEVDFEANSGPFVITVVAENTQPPFWNDTALVIVSVSDSNDNHPILSLGTLRYSYVEGSPPISIAPDLTITDVDTHIHLLSTCEVTLMRGSCQLSSSELTSACGSSNSECIALCAEEIAIDGSLGTSRPLELSTVTNATSQTLAVSGNGSETDYQTVLSSLTYFNRALEPSLGTRHVSIQCMDAGLVSNTLVISINVTLINDNPILIKADPQHLLFLEGTTTLPVGRLVQLQLIDLDFDPEAAWVEVTLETPREPLSERVSVNSTSVDGGGVVSGLNILVNQTSPLQNYQVCQSAVDHNTCAYKCLPPSTPGITELSHLLLHCTRK